MQAIDQLRDMERLAVDTEFHAERRHQPEVMLFQINDLEGTTWVIDPLSVDISPLGTLVSDRTVILHSGAQDLAILWRETQRLPTAVFDVQVAAGMIGMRHPMRLNEIVEQVLEEPMDKGETLSDWSTRPLTNAQLRYAARDVEVLGPLTERLNERLTDQGRAHWVEEECLSMLERASSPADTNHTWVNWDIAPRLAPSVQRTLGCLFEWRNQKGRDKGQPANFMLSDGLALDIARRQPQTLAELAANRRIPQGLIRRMGSEIVAVVRHVNDHDIALPTVPTPTEFKRANTIRLWAEAWGNSHQVAPNLMVSIAHSHAIAKDGVAALHGWRAEAFGEALEHFLTGQTQLGINENGVCLVEGRN